MSLDTYSQQGWLTAPAKRRRHESAWLSLQKFAFVNVLTGRQISDLLKAEVDTEGGQRETVAAAIGAEVDWLRANKVRQIGPSKAAEDFLGGQSPFVVEDKCVKYCPACLQHWFHSTVHQVAAVVACPHHGVPLRSDCPNCGEPMPEFGFRTNDLREPLRCAHCMQPFHQDASLRALFAVSEELKAILATFASLEQSIRSCFATRRLTLGMQFPSRYSNEVDLRQSYFVSLWVLEYGTAIPRFLADVPAYCWGPMVKKDGDEAMRRIGSSSMDERKDAMQMLRVAGQQVRSVDRLLRRRVRSICGHESLPRMSFGYVYWFREKRFFLHVRPSDCACCMTLVHWRASYGGLMDMIQRLNRIGRSITESAVASILGFDRNFSSIATYAATQFERSVVSVATQLQTAPTTTKHFIGYQLARPEELSAELDRLWVDAFADTLDPRVVDMHCGTSLCRIQPDVIDQLLRDLAGATKERPRDGAGAGWHEPRSLWFCEIGSEMFRRRLNGWYVGAPRMPVDAEGIHFDAQ